MLAILALLLVGSLAQDEPWYEDWDPTPRNEYWNYVKNIASAVMDYRIDGSSFDADLSTFESQRLTFDESGDNLEWACWDPISELVQNSYSRCNQLGTV